METFNFKSSVFTSGQSSKKASLFRPEIMKEKDEIERKNFRTKCRKFLVSVLHTFNLQNKKLTEDQKKEFLNFYKSIYLLNDFSVSSLYDGADQEKKMQLQKLLDFCKTENKK